MGSVSVDSLSIKSQNYGQIPIEINVEGVEVTVPGQEVKSEKQEIMQDDYYQEKEEYEAVEIEYEDTSYSEESEENFEWYHEGDSIFTENDTWFVLVNNDRKNIWKGDQACYCYGNRSNNYLMSSYGFCFPNNRFDSYSFKICTNLEENPAFYDRE